MFATLVALAVLAPSALATVSMTSPTASTNWQAGQQVSIAWQDDGKAPALKDFGPSQVGVFVGDTIQQAEVFHIADNVDVSTTSQINWTVDGSFGPSASFYFIRFTSNSCKDTSTPMNYPCEAFSAKFALSNMNGNLNSTIQQIAQGSSGAAPSGSASGAAPPSGSASATTPNPTGSASHSSSPSGASGASTSAKPTGAAQAAGASGLFASAGLVAAIASVVGSFML